MNGNFAPSLARVLQHEGGYVDDPQDPGGATNHGVTQAAYDAWRQSHGLARSPVRGISAAEVAAIYRQNYWNAIWGDELPAGVDYAVFDFAVNSGVKRASRYLQRIVGVPDDGQVGPVTIAAVNAKPACATIAALSAARLDFLGQLPTFPRFGKGWTTRVADVGLTAAEMAA